MKKTKAVSFRTPDYQGWDKMDMVVDTDDPRCSLCNGRLHIAPHGGIHCPNGKGHGQEAPQKADKHKVTIYRASGNVDIYELDKAPSLEQLQASVGGLIERVPEEYYQVANPWFTRQHKGEVDAVWCNEEGLLVAAPVVNPFWEAAPWGDRLVGNVTVVEKIK